MKNLKTPDRTHSPLTLLKTETCSTREAALMLGVSRRTVQLWVDAGMLEAWKTVGGHRRVTLSSIKRLAGEFANESPSSDDCPSPPPTEEAGTILIVEDDADLLTLYQANVDTWNLPIKLLTASNGFEGLIKIGESSPDLLVTDLDMPGMDGFQMLRALRANPGYGDMQIIVVSGLDNADIEARGGIPRDVTPYPKPVPFDRLREAVEACIVKRRQPRVAVG